MYKIKHILLIIVGLLLVSCASNRPNRVHKQVMTQRTQVTLTFDQHEYKTNCMLKVWKNELIVLSVTPVMGIELFRLEATPDQVTIIDKLNRRYTIMTYEDINKLSPRRISYKMLQLLINKAGKEINLDLQAGTHTLQLKANMGQRENIRKSHKWSIPTNTSKLVCAKSYLYEKKIDHISTIVVAFVYIRTKRQGIATTATSPSTTIGGNRQNAQANQKR